MHGDFHCEMVATQHEVTTKTRYTMRMLLCSSSCCTAALQRTICTTLALRARSLSMFRCVIVVKLRMYRLIEVASPSGRYYPARESLQSHTKDTSVAPLRHSVKISVERADGTVHHRPWLNSTSTNNSLRGTMSGEGMLCSDALSVRPQDLLSYASCRDN